MLGLGEWFCEEAASPLLEDRITAAEGLGWGDLETLDRTVDLGSEFSAQTLDTALDLGSEFSAQTLDTTVDLCSEYG